jgi:hypothetical protein
MLTNGSKPHSPIELDSRPRKATVNRVASTTLHCSRDCVPSAWRNKDADLPDRADFVSPEQALGGLQPRRSPHPALDVVHEDPAAVGRGVEHGRRHALGSRSAVQATSRNGSAPGLGLSRVRCRNTKRPTRVSMRRLRFTLRPPCSGCTLRGASPPAHPGMRRKIDTGITPRSDADMSTPNHWRHFGALGATASGIKVSGGARPPGLALREAARHRTRNPRTSNHSAPTRSNLPLFPEKTAVAGFIRGFAADPLPQGHFDGRFRRSSSRIARQ